MATYSETPQKEAPFWHPTGPENLAFRCATRIYANGDIVKLWKLERDTKIVHAVVGNERLDSNGVPTLAGVLRLNDGTTQVTLVTCGTAILGAAAGSVTFTTNQAAVGYILPTRGFWLEFFFTAGPATAVTGILSFGVQLSFIHFGGESPLRPTG